MTVDLRIIEPVHLAADVSPVEARTWARLHWSIGNLVASRHVRAEGVRETIAVPTASLSKWVLHNWWNILYELAPLTVEAPLPGWQALDRAQAGWRHRHSLRVSDSSLCLPDLRICSSGNATLWSLVKDDPGAGPMRYLDEGTQQVPRQEAVLALGGLIQATLTACQGLVDSEVTWMRDRWSQVQQSMAEAGEAEFCRAAGRLGLDPYDVLDWPSGLLDWMTSAAAGALDRAYYLDLQGFGGDIADLPAVAKATQLLIEGQNLTAGETPRNARDSDLVGAEVPAWELGYNRAARVRRNARLTADEPVHDIAAVLHAATGTVLTTSALALAGPMPVVAGWKGQGLHLLAKRQGGSRIALVQGVALGLWSAAEGARLVTDARDQDHRAARAFAAELLAPRHKVEEMVDHKRRSMPLDDAKAEVAEAFQVSFTVVDNQFNNARAGR
jgi:hypothetical protein